MNRIILYGDPRFYQRNSDTDGERFVHIYKIL